MAKIICLANSLKHRDRCIAGIDVSTGKWIRPVSNLDDGRVSRDVCLVNGEEPKLLDILEIPLADSSPGYECENRLILPGQWKLEGKASASDLVAYCESEILYKQWTNSVPFSFLQELAPENRRTLQLIRIPKINLRKYNDTGKWEASFPVTNLQSTKAKITDLAFIERLNNGTDISQECLITISLAQPWRKSPSEELACWKLIAAVIELSEIDLVLFEMERIGWTKKDGSLYLQENYNKKMRQELTETELREFLDYLKLKSFD